VLAKLFVPAKTYERRFPKRAYPHARNTHFVVHRGRRASSSGILRTYIVGFAQQGFFFSKFASIICFSSSQPSGSFVFARPQPPRPWPDERRAQGFAEE
jgi:hypothetical protein